MAVNKYLKIKIIDGIITMGTWDAIGIIAMERPRKMLRSIRCRAVGLPLSIVFSYNSYRKELSVKKQMNTVLTKNALFFYLNINPMRRADGNREESRWIYLRQVHEPV